MLINLWLKRKPSPLYGLSSTLIASCREGLIFCKEDGLLPQRYIYLIANTYRFFLNSISSFVCVSFSSRWYNCNEWSERFVDEGTLIVTYTAPFIPSATSLRQGNVFTRVCDSVHRRRGGAGRQADTPLGRYPPPPDSHCSGWYASYWNAFLFFIQLNLSFMVTLLSS